MVDQGTAIEAPPMVMTPTEVEAVTKEAVQEYLRGAPGVVKRVPVPTEEARVREEAERRAEEHKRKELSRIIQRKRQLGIIEATREYERGLREVKSMADRRRALDRFQRTLGRIELTRETSLVQAGLKPQAKIAGITITPESAPEMEKVLRGEKLTRFEVAELERAGLKFRPTGIQKIELPKEPITIRKVLEKTYETAGKVSAAVRRVGAIGPISPYELETGKFVAGLAPAITIPATAIPGTMFMAGRVKEVVEKKEKVEKAEKGARAMIRAIEKLMKEKKTKLAAEKAIDKLLKKESAKALAKGVSESAIKAQLKDILTFLQDRGLFTKVYEIGARVGIPLVVAAPFYTELVPADKEALKIIPKVIEVPKEKLKEKVKLVPVLVFKAMAGFAPALKPPIEKVKLAPVLPLKFPEPLALKAPAPPAMPRPPAPRLEVPSIFFKPVPIPKRVVEEKLKPAEVLALKKLAVGYRLWVTRKEKVKLFPGLFPKAEAIMKGIEITGKTLAVTFGVIPTKEVITIKKELPEVMPSPLVYRPYKIKKGVKIPLKLTWIQRARFRLAAPGEVAEIIKARKVKTKKGGRVRWL